MTPTIVLKDGKPVLALGSPGGPTIINTVLEVIVNVIDFGMNVQDAVNWPRFHHQWLPDELRMEPGFSPDTVALLEKRGYTVKRVNAQGECAAIALPERLARRRARSPHRRHGGRTLTHQMKHVLSTHLFVNHRLTVALLLARSSRPESPRWRSSARASTWTIATRRRSPNSATGSAIPS